MNGGHGDGGGFAAHPRVINQKPKFKDPYAAMTNE